MSTMPTWIVFGLYEISGRSMATRPFQNVTLDSKLEIGNFEAWPTIREVTDIHSEPPVTLTSESIVSIPVVVSESMIKFEPSYFYPMMADHILNTCRLYYFQVWLMVGPDSQAFHRGKLSPFDQWPWLQSTHPPPHLPSFHHHIAPHFSLPQQFHWYFGWIFAVFPIDINVFVEYASEFFREDPPSLHGFHGFHQLASAMW